MKVYKRVQPCRRLHVRNMQRAVMSESLHHLSSINTSVRCMHSTEHTIGTCHSSKFPF